MPRQDTTDFLTAFAIGTVLGVGAALLLRRPKPTPRQRLARELKPHTKRLRRSYATARGAVREGASATGEMTGEVISAGRELLGEFRSEVARILADARDDLKKLAEERVKEARKQARKSGRKLGM
jgi:gas vesicle protein